MMRWKADSSLQETYGLTGPGIHDDTIKNIIYSVITPYSIGSGNKTTIGTIIRLHLGPFSIGP